VDSATLAQIAFDGMIGDPYAGVYLAGESSVNDGTWSTVTGTTGGASFTRKLKTISLGKTFSSPPQVLWTLKDINAVITGGVCKYAYVDTSGAETSLYARGATTWASCDTTTLTLRVDRPNTYLGNLDWIFSYMVFQT
jgi:hypothetical protein